MPQMIEVKDHGTEIIFNSRDFEDAIDKYMGMECAKFYHQQIGELSELIRDLVQYINNEDVKADVEEVLKVNGY